MSIKDFQKRYFSERTVFLRIKRDLSEEEAKLLKDYVSVKYDGNEINLGTGKAGQVLIMEGGGGRIHNYTHPEFDQDTRSHYTRIIDDLRRDLKNNMGSHTPNEQEECVADLIDQGVLEPASRKDVLGGPPSVKEAWSKFISHFRIS